jgi:hypothetical protein
MTIREAYGPGERAYKDGISSILDSSPSRGAAPKCPAAWAAQRVRGQTVLRDARHCEPSRRRQVGS